MIFDKIKKKSAAVSMVVVLIAGAVFIPAASYAFGNIANTTETEGDRIKESMPYQVLGPDYERPIEFTEGYEEIDLDELVVPKPTFSGSSHETKEVPYKTGLYDKINPHIFTAPEGASLNIQMRYSKNTDMSNSVNLTVIPGMENDIYLDTIGYHYVEISAVSVMHFNVNGDTVTRYSEAAVKNIRIHAKASVDFNMYGYTVLPNLSTIPTNQTIQLRMVMSERILSISYIYISVDGGAYRLIPDYGRYASGDTGIVFLNLQNDVILQKHIDMANPYPLIRIKVVMRSESGKTAYPEVHFRVRK